MAPRFIGKTSLGALHPVRLDGQPVLELYARLRALLRSRAGPDAAALFAEPVITWSSAGGAGSVSWYTEAPGRAEPFAALSPDRRGVAEQKLREIVRHLGPLLADAEAGAMVRRAVALGGRKG